MSWEARDKGFTQHSTVELENNCFSSLSKAPHHGTDFSSLFLLSFSSFPSRLSLLLLGSSSSQATPPNRILFHLKEFDLLSNSIAPDHERSTDLLTREEREKEERQAEESCDYSPPISTLNYRNCILLRKFNKWHGLISFANSRHYTGGNSSDNIQGSQWKIIIMPAEFTIYKAL